MTNAELNYQAPLDHMSVGTKIADFTVERQIEVVEIAGYAYILRHTSGARVMWLACADTNKSFAIGFKTPPVDSTGVFHILEHSVLCGSTSYPVKEPFVNLIKTSMNTFLNAMTFPDKTVYPVASTNEKDLENLMDVYLDAVFHPNIYTNKFIFEQEGWHKELNEDDSKLTYNGVVYNEMRGAYSEPSGVLWEKLTEYLYPDTCYRHDSGGNPLNIPDLTYENFLDNHARHYQLANSYTIFYGNVDIERQLERLGKVFDTVQTPAGEPNELKAQSPLAPQKTSSTMVGSPDNSCVGLSYCLDFGAGTLEEVALDVLMSTLMGSNEAPLKKKLISLGLGQDVFYSVTNSFMQPMLSFELRGAKEGAADQFAEAIISTCSRLVKRGISKDQLESQLSSLEFVMREADFGYPAGIEYTIDSLSTWLYDEENPVGVLLYEEKLAELKKLIETDYFEKLLEKVILNNEHYVLHDLKCIEVEEGLNEREIALQESLASLSEDEKKAIHKEVELLREEQETPDKPEDIAKLPQLGIEDIGEMAPEPHQHSITSPLPCTHHEVETHNIAYLYGNFWLDGILYEHLPYVNIMANLIGKLDTERYTAEELAVEIPKNFGHSAFYVEAYENFENPDKIKAAFVAGTATLSYKIDAMKTLLPELLLKTKFEDKERIRNILIQMKSTIEQGYIGSGHIFSAARAQSYFNKASLFSQKVMGIDFYRFLSDLIENFDDRFASLSDTLAFIQKKIFVANNCDFSFAGSSDDFEYFWDVAGTLGMSKDENLKPMLEIPEPHVRNEAFIIPSNVVYNAQVKPTAERMIDNSGAWSIIAKALSYDYLWNDVRVKGGAYGCGFRNTLDLLVNFSYRDPQVDRTFKAYDNQGAWIDAWDPTDSELVGYIVSSVAQIDAPVSPRALARRQDTQRYCETPEGRKEEHRNQIINCTKEELKKLSEALKDSDQPIGRCIFGNKKLIEDADVDMIKLNLFEG